MGCFHESTRLMRIDRESAIIKFCIDNAFTLCCLYQNRLIVYLHKMRKTNNYGVADDGGSSERDINALIE